MVIGTAFVIFVIAIMVVSLFVFRTRFEREVAGINCRGKAPPGEEAVLQLIVDHIHKEWPDKANDILEDVEVEWVENIRTADLPNGKLPDGRLVAGTVDYRQPLPGQKIMIALLRNRDKHDVPYEHVRFSAVAHEILEHIVPSRLGLGTNWDHKNEVVEAAYKRLDARAKP